MAKERQAIEAALGEEVELVASPFRDKLKEDGLERLTSRKFLLTVVAAVTTAVAGQWTEFVAVILAYLGVEGVVDLRSVGHQVNVVLEDAEAKQAQLPQ